MINFLTFSSLFLLLFKSSSLKLLFFLGVSLLFFSYLIYLNLIISILSFVLIILFGGGLFLLTRYLVIIAKEVKYDSNNLLLSLFVILFFCFLIVFTRDKNKIMEYFLVNPMNFKIIILLLVIMPLGLIWVNFFIDTKKGSLRVKLE